MVKCPIPPPPPLPFGPIRIPYPKELNCWFKTWKIVILSYECIPQ